MVKWFTCVLCSMVGLVHGQSVLSWSFKNPKTSEWNAFGEKGSIQEKLYQSGELPDPFYGKNEEPYQWIETYKWEFKSQFYLSEEQFKAKKIAIHIVNESF